MSPSCADSGSLGSSSVFYGVCIAEDDDGAVDKGSGDIITFDVQSPF